MNDDKKFDLGALVVFLFYSSDIIEADVVLNVTFPF